MNKIIITLLIGIFLISFISADHALPSDLVDERGSLMEGLGSWAYEVTNGIFWGALLLGFCVVLFISTIKYDVDRAFGFAGITGLFGSIILLILDWMSWWLASLFILTGAIAIALMYKQR